jgi:alpha-methylacyl-CoA racemase
MRTALATAFRSKPREEWQKLFAGSDACFAPVLDMAEAPQHPHNRARNTFVDVEGVMHPAPAPRFSRTQPDTPQPPKGLGAELAVLEQFGLSRQEIAALSGAGLLHGAGS